MPGEYAILGKTPRTGSPPTSIATASLVGGIFGKGGGARGREHRCLNAAGRSSAPSPATQVWHDFRRQNDPEAPTTVRGTNFPYQLADTTTRPPSPSPTPARCDTAAATTGTTPSDAALAESLIGAGRPAGRATRTRCWSRAPSRVRPPAGRDGPPGRLLHAPDPDRGGPARPGHRRPGRRLRRRQPLRAARARPATSPGRPPPRARTSSTPWPSSSASRTAPPRRSQSICTTSTRATAAPMETLTRTNAITPNPGDPSPPETLHAHRAAHRARNRPQARHGRAASRSPS